MPEANGGRAIFSPSARASAVTFARAFVVYSAVVQEDADRIPPGQHIATMKPRILLGVIAACFFASGAAALLYEVVWLRLLGLMFGHTVHAITTVLAAYMGGLALGSFVFGRWADHARRPLRTYAFLEAGIGLYCLATPLLFAGADRLYLAVHHAIEPSSGAATAIQFGLSAVLLLVPTTLMGATLPLLSRVVAERAALVGSRVGTLYALNTWGAVAGTAATGFFLLPSIGLRATILLGVAVNAIVAAVALVVDAWLSRIAAGAPQRRVAAEAADAAPPPPLAVWLALAAIGVSGAASMAYEIAWTRGLSLVVGSSTYAFSAMLTTFLAGLALGALAVSAALRRWRFGLGTFAVVEIAIGIAALALLPVFGALPELFLSVMGRLEPSHGTALLTQFALSSLTMIVPTFLIGATLPLVIAALSRGVDEVGRHVGKVYGANTIGTIIGSAVAGFALLPLVGIETTVRIAAAVNVLVGVVVLSALEGRTRARLVGAVASVAALAALTALLPRWDRNVMVSGVSVYAQTFLQDQEDASVRQAVANRELLFYEEGLNTTVSVVRLDGEHIALSVNGKFDGGNGADMATQLLLGQLPALFHTDAHRALVIGLGTGVTAGALAQHPLEAIDVAELEPAVLRAARFFSKENHGVLDDPRVRIIEGDGRHVLAAAATPYDLVISEPSNPWIAGVGNLFTREFYQTAREHLSDRGVMVQWLQGYSIFPREMRMVVRTFQEVFPDATIWRATPNDYLLVGSRTPLELDLAAMERRVAESAGTRTDLARLRTDVEELLYRFHLSAEDARRYAEGAPLNTDDLPLLEFAAPRALYAANSAQENARLLAGYRRVEWPRVRGLDVSQFDSPQKLVGRARKAWLRGSTADAAAWLARAGSLDGEDETTRLERARLLFALGRLNEAMEDFESLRRSRAEDPAIQSYLEAGRILQSRNLGLTLLHQVAASSGSEPGGAHERFGAILVTLAWRIGEPALLPIALEHWGAALALAPTNSALANSAALAHLGLKQYEAGIALLRRTASHDPGNAETQFNLGLLYQEQGRVEYARRAYEEALRLRPGWPLARDRVDQLRGRDRSR
jgi:spermidine synthase